MLAYTLGFFVNEKRKKDHDCTMFWQDINTVTATRLIYKDSYFG